MNEQVIMETIQRMSSSGLDDDVIIATLKDIGLDEGRAKEMMAKARGVPEKVEVVEAASTPQAQYQMSKSTNPYQNSMSQQRMQNNQMQPINMGYENIADATANRVKEQLDDHAIYTQMATNELQSKVEEHSNLMNEHIQKIDQSNDFLNKQARQINSIQSSVGDISNRINKVAPAVNSSNPNVQAELEEIKAITLATKSLMEKILEVNRMILNRLQ